MQQSLWEYFWVLSTGATSQHGMNNKQETHTQKHHLQIACCVKAPPKTGPTQMLMPNTLTTNPKYNGRFSKGTAFVIIFNAPWKSPAAPQPAIARPTMKTDDLRAVAQIIEPTLLQSDVSSSLFGITCLQTISHRPDMLFWHCKAYKSCQKRAVMRW